MALPSTRLLEPRRRLLVGVIDQVGDVDRVTGTTELTGKAGLTQITRSGCPVNSIILLTTTGLVLVWISSSSALAMAHKQRPTPSPATSNRTFFIKSSPVTTISSLAPFKSWEIFLLTFASAEPVGSVPVHPCRSSHRRGSMYALVLLELRPAFPAGESTGRALGWVLGNASWLRI